MIPVLPEMLESDRVWLAVAFAQIEFRAGGKPFGEIGQQLRDNFPSYCRVASGSGLPATTDGLIQGEDSIFQNLKRKPLVQFHPGRTEKRANRFGRATLASDHFSEILRMNPQFEDGDLRTLHCFHLHSLRMIHQRSSNVLYEFFHRAPACTALVELLHANLPLSVRGRATQ